MIAQCSLLGPKRERLKGSYDVIDRPGFDQRREGDEAAIGAKGWGALSQSRS